MGFKSHYNGIIMTKLLTDDQMYAMDLNWMDTPPESKLAYFHTMMKRPCGIDRRHIKDILGVADHFSALYKGIPSEAMCDKARGFIMGLDLNIRTWGAMQRHLDMSGYPTLDYIKNKAIKAPDGHITKWDVADCIYQLMTMGD